MIQRLFDHRQTFTGYDTRVLELKGDGVPIVLFHGYVDSADTWRKMLDLIARQGRRAIAVDLPGFGTADPLLSEPILPQLDDFAVAAVRYASGSRHEPVLAVGNSLGGCIVLRLAQRHPAKLAGVVPIAPAGLEMTRLLGLVQRDPVLRALLALAAPVPGLVLRAAVARLYRQLAFAVPSAIDPRVVSASRGTTPPDPRAAGRARARADLCPGVARLGRPRPARVPPRSQAASGCRA